MVLLDKMVQPLAQPSKLASGTTENDLTFNQLYGFNQLNHPISKKEYPTQNDPIA